MEACLGAANSSGVGVKGINSSEVGVQGSNFSGVGVKVDLRSEGVRKHVLAPLAPRERGELLCLFRDS